MRIFQSTVQLQTAILGTRIITFVTDIIRKRVIMREISYQKKHTEDIEFACQSVIILTPHLNVLTLGLKIISICFKRKGIQLLKTIL